MRPGAPASIQVLDGDFERLVMCHGNVIEHDRNQVLRESVSWLRA